MASNVSKPSTEWQGWTPASLPGLVIYADPDTLPSDGSYISTWNAVHGSGSFAYYGSQPWQVSVGGVRGAAFSNGFNTFLTRNVGDVAANNFSFGCLVYSNTAQEWKNPISLTTGFDPASRQLCRIETGGGSTAAYGDVQGVSVGGDLNASSWIFASMRNSTGGKSFQRQGVLSVAGGTNASGTFNRCNLGANYYGNRWMTCVIAAAWFCSQDVGVENIMRLERYLANKLGLIGNLNAAHWNKTFPPFTKRFLWATEMFVSVG